MFSHQNIVCISHPSHACHMHRPSHPPSFDLLNNIWWSVQVMTLFSMQICVQHPTSP
jgi:hypothetical protein